MKKMLVSDYDQTFYINDDDIELNKDAVDKFMKLGNIFVIATGRSYFDFNNKKEIYNLKYDYVILNHGTTILDKNNNILLNVSMPNNIITNIKNDLKLNKSLKFFCCSGIDSRVDFSHSDLTKIYVKYESKEEAMEIANIINNKYYDNVVAYYVSYNTVEIISNQANKKLSIYNLMDRDNIDKENVYSIGDSYSDIEMVKEFNGYCVENSIGEIKDIATDIVSSVSILIDKILNKNI